jgi:deazaflavin-dependent oxidoreductase (nitroreductase family)
MVSGSPSLFPPARTFEATNELYSTNVPMRNHLSHIAIEPQQLTEDQIVYCRRALWSLDRNLIKLLARAVGPCPQSHEPGNRVLLSASGGRLGWRPGEMPVIELTTTGRKSDQPRMTMLTSLPRRIRPSTSSSYRGADDTNPARFLDLRDEPKVMVKQGPAPSMLMLAQIADSEERARIWSLIANKHRNYAGYQRKTERETPLVLLRPASP